MITRRPSKIIDSVVNSAHEEHFNVVKAIRDNAPVTDLTAVAKSINFISEGDGSYVLRKPLVKHSSLSESQIMLYDKETILDTANNSINIQNKYIILKFYDADGKLHEVNYPNGMASSWLQVNKVFNTADHTILSTKINHTIFTNTLNDPNSGTDVVIDHVESDPTHYLERTLTAHSRDTFTALPDITKVSCTYTVLGMYGQDIIWANETVTRQPDYIDLDENGHLIVQIHHTVGSGYGPMDQDYRLDDDITNVHIAKPIILIHDEWDSVSGYQHPYATANLLNRFVKIYKHEDLEDTFVFEIVNTEPNTITSGLDTQNANTLDINLLLDNPYSIRDLYNYGAMNATKILAYVNLDKSIIAHDILRQAVWELTEKGEFFNKSKGFKLVSSLARKNIEYPYIVLKAFLTTAISAATYYCVWEYSDNDGISWKTCPEFINRFGDRLQKVKVVDLTSDKFNEVVKEDSLEKANTYIVEKDVAVLTSNLSEYDRIMDRPDILVLSTNAHQAYLYRFCIYLKTNQPTPTPVEYTVTKKITDFEDGSTVLYFDEEHKVSLTPHIDTSWHTEYFNSARPNKVENGYLRLGNQLSTMPWYPNDTTQVSGKTYVRTFGGDYIVVQATDNITLKSVKITLAEKRVETDSFAITCGYPNTGYGSHLAQYKYGDDTNLRRNQTSFDAFDIDGQVESAYFGYHEKTAHIKPCWIPEKSSKTFTHIINNSVIIADVNTFVRESTDNEALRKELGIVDYYGYQHDFRNPPKAYYNFMETRIAEVEVEYLTTEVPLYSDTYLVSMTGVFSFIYSEKTQLVEDLSYDRNRLFSGELYYNDKQSQLLVYKDSYIYSSGTNSAIFRLMNSLSIPDSITKIIPWRGYLLFFSAKNIYLAKYDASADTYNFKVLSNTVGVSKTDANTIVPILNSVYFKSGNKVYKLVPNLYASSDDILNIHQVSDGINIILENLSNEITESTNFGYSDSDTYHIFIPDVANECTYCLIYDFNKHIWNLVKYEEILTEIHKVSVTTAYVVGSEKTIYHFRESLKTLLTEGIQQWCEDNSENPGAYPLDVIFNAVPYCDYMNATPVDLIPLAIANVSAGGSFEDAFANVKQPIYFEIDFGQKSSNYTLYKQFLETKLTLATLSSKDTFPVDLEILTDGVSRHLHIDSNTDGALWKTSLDQVGTLNTHFNFEGQDFNGIMRQLIVKYSGRGKSIRHIISGTSKSLFKFYSMDVRARILPKKM